jgi:hypothetical protein
VIKRGFSIESHNKRVPFSSSRQSLRDLLTVDREPSGWILVIVMHPYLHRHWLPHLFAVILYRSVEWEVATPKKEIKRNQLVTLNVSNKKNVVVPTSSFVAPSTTAVPLASWLSFKWLAINSEWSPVGVIGLPPGKCQNNTAVSN